jgi:hypothetical protein
MALGGPNIYPEGSTTYQILTTLQQIQEEIRELHKEVGRIPKRGLLYTCSICAADNIWSQDLHSQSHLASSEEFPEYTLSE